MKSLLIVLPFLAACSSSYMRNAGGSVEPGPDEAKVIVFRNSPVGFLFTYAVTDGSELIGVAEAGSYFETIRKAGPHTFVAWGESDDAVEAVLEPQKTYYLRFYTRSGFFSPGAGLAPVPATAENWARMDDLLPKLSRRELIPERGAAWMKSHSSIQEKKVDPGHWMKPYDGR